MARAATGKGSYAISGSYGLTSRLSIAVCLISAATDAGNQTAMRALALEWVPDWYGEGF